MQPYAAINAEKMTLYLLNARQMTHNSRRVRDIVRERKRNPKLATPL